MGLYKPYLIRTPPYDPTSGGIKVMWALYGWLLSKGQDVFINLKSVDHQAIGIYPEIYHGNEMETQTVVRYLLNRPGVMGTNNQFGQIIPGPTQFDPEDKLYIFSRIFDDEDKFDDDHVLFLPAINLHIFKNFFKKRNKTAYFVGKGINTNQHPEDAVLIDRNVASNQSLLAELLNECQTLYGYDPVSAMYEVARLCGCKVQLYQDSIPKKRWEKYEPGMNGIGWKKDKELDVKAFRKHYINLIMRFDKQIDKFIEETQK